MVDVLKEAEMFYAIAEYDEQGPCESGFMTKEKVWEWVRHHKKSGGALGVAVFDHNHNKVYNWDRY